MKCFLLLFYLFLATLSICRECISGSGLVLPIELNLKVRESSPTVSGNHAVSFKALRHFRFSYLRSKAILDEEDCERIINTGNTRQQKVSIFLDVIKRKGSNGMKHFVDALEYEYPELYKKMTGNDAASRGMYAHKVFTQNK